MIQLALICDRDFVVYKQDRHISVSIRALAPS